MTVYIYIYIYRLLKKATTKKGRQGKKSAPQPKSWLRLRVTSLMDKLKYRQLYKCNDCIINVSQLYRAYVTTCGHVRRPCRVVKRKSCETYWILLERLTTTHVSFEVTVPSSLIVTN